MKRIAVVLAGCGVFDGTEIQEAVITFLHIEKKGGTYECFAPNVPQYHVINHIDGSEKKQDRNVMEEAGRIARGNIKPLVSLDVDMFDALVIPGGFGVAKNLCDFAITGSDLEINPALVTVVQKFKAKNKPVGLICIAPVMAGKLFGRGTLCTIGDDQKTARKIEQTGAVHLDCPVDDIVVDEKVLLVTTPAYMLARHISEIDKGIGKLIEKLVSLC